NEPPIVNKQTNDESIMNIEDHYDYRQVYLKTLINSVSEKLIHEKIAHALFHISLMPTRWFQDNTLSKVDLASNEPFIEASFKKDKDQKALDNLILSYISEQEAS
ncbi:12693_t:CDS:2, partial [Dentiscutata erythropus]